MGRCNFNNTCTKFSVYIAVGNNRYFLVYYRKNNHFAYNVFISFIVRMNCNGSIAKHCFRSCCGNFYKSAFFPCNRVFNMPEMTFHINMVYFGIGNCCHTLRAPVNKFFTFINIALVVKTHECFQNSIAASFIKSKANPVPVTA